MQPMLVAVLLLSLGLWSRGVHGVDSDSPVVQLTSDSFNSLVQATPQVWIVEYIQNNCQPCLDFAPEYSNLAAALRGMVKVGVLNCMDDPAVCAQQKVQRIPSIKVYGWDVRKNPYTGQLYKDDDVFFEGRARYKEVLKFAHDSLPDKFVSNVSAGESFDKFLASSPELPKVLLVSAKQSVPPMYKALSLRFRGSLLFGQVSSSDSTLVHKLQAKSFPAIFLLQPGKESSPVQYEGQVAVDDIAAFLRQFAAEASGAAAAAATGADGGGQQASSGEGEGAPVWVRPVSAEQLRKDVLENEEVFLVALLDHSAADDCDKKVEEWHKKGSELLGVLFAREVNITTPAQQKELEAVYKVPANVGRSCVSFLLFPFGDDKEDSDPVVLPEETDAKALIQAAYDIAPGTFVTHLSKHTFEGFAYADIKAAKFILFSSKSDVPPLFRLLSTNFREGSQFGFVTESQKEMVDEFHVTKFPTVLALVASPSKEDPAKMGLQILQYNGALNFRSLVQFVLQVSAQLRNTLGVALEIPKVEDDDQFSLYCIEPNKLCVVGLLTTEALLEDVRRVAGKWANGGQFSFMWLDASRGSAGAGVARQLSVPQSALPTAVVIIPSKKRIAVLPEALTSEALNSFLDGLLLGRVRTSELQALPNFATAAETGPLEEDQSESGSSAAETGVGSTAEEEAPVEEEFDLADIMSEHVEDEEALSKEHKLQEVEKELERQEQEKSSKKKKKKKGKGKKKKSGKDEL